MRKIEIAEKFLTSQDRDVLQIYLHPDKQIAVPRKGSGVVRTETEEQYESVKLLIHMLRLDANVPKGRRGAA